MVWFNDECYVEDVDGLEQCLSECKAFPIDSKERDECEFRCYMRYCLDIEEGD